MRMFIDGKEIPVTWENNQSVKALEKQVQESSITVQMNMYGGFEQVGSLGKSYPSADQSTRTKNGDIVLYCGNQIVVFYGSNSWSYTRLGKMKLPAGEVKELLSGGNVTLELQK